MTSIFPVSASAGQEFSGYNFDGESWNLIGNEFNPTVYSGSEPVGGKAGDIWIDSSIDVPAISPETILTIDSASAIYLNKVSASTTYATKAELANIDLSSASAAAVAAIVDSAPATLNTLNELAAALNDDANFSSTVTTSLGNKLDVSTASSTYLTQLSASTTYAAKSGGTFSGNITAPEVRASTKIVAQTVGGDEGGEILLGKAATNTTLTGDGVTIDVFQNRLRIFEQGGNARGGYFDVSKLSDGVGTNLTPGLTQIIPTSVSVGSGSGTVSAGGAVTFSGATSISLNGAFTSTYQNYRLLINFYGSVAGNVFVKFRDNSGDISTGYYGGGIYVSFGGTIGATGLRNNGTEMYIQTSWTDSNQRNLAHFDLQRSPVGTQGAMIGNVWDNWNGNVATHGYHRNDMTNFNGLTIYPASGNLTGTVRVYGYNNG